MFTFGATRYTEALNKFRVKTALLHCQATINR